MEKSKLEIGVQYFTLVVAGCWAVVGFLYAFSKDRTDLEFKKFDIVSEIIKQCSSPDPTTQQSGKNYIALLLSWTDNGSVVANVFGDIEHVKSLQNNCNSLATIASATPRSGQAAGIVVSEQVKDEIKRLAENPPPAPVVAANAIPSSPSAPPNDGKRFWIYLGNYNAKTRKWVTKYIDFSDGFDPATFNVQTDPQKGAYKLARTTAALNVRFGEFSQTGDFPPITNTPILASLNKPVKILTMAQWFDSGDWWATIAPQ